MKTPTSVSVVVPTLNGMPRIQSVLDGLLSQKTDVPFELYCVDSGSSDGTWEEITARGIRGSQIERSSFNHGQTRNQAIAETDGELIALTVQDATPGDDHWLQHLIDATLSSDNVAGSYSRQIPYPEANPFVRLRLEAWAAGRTKRNVQCLEEGSSLDSLPPLERLAMCALDNVSSMIRRSVWEKHPLPKRRFGEDVAWGKSVIEAGHSIVFEPNSFVVHSHNADPIDEFRRIYLDHANLNELFGIQTIPSLASAIRNSRSQFKTYQNMIGDQENTEEQTDQLTRLARKIARAETFGQWLGARSVIHAPPRGAFYWIERFVTRRS